MDGNDEIPVWDYLRIVANDRWLCAEEIFIALCADPVSIGSWVSEGFNFKSDFEVPKNGDLFLFKNKNALKEDNVVYVKKKSKDRPQETYQTLKLNGNEEIRGIYSRAEDRLFDLGLDRSIAKPVLKRRVYKKKDGQTDLFLVHYRECPEDERPEKHTVNSRIFGMCNMLYLSITEHRQQRLNTQKQVLPTQSHISQYSSLSSFQPELDRSQSHMNYSSGSTAQQQHSIYQHAQGAPSSFSNASQTTAGRSFDEFDTFDPEMMDDLIEFLDYEGQPAAHSDSTFTNAFPAQAQVTPPSYGAPQRRMTREDLPVPLQQQEGIHLMQSQMDVQMYSHGNHNTGQSLFGASAFCTNSFPYAHQQSPSPHTSLPASLAPSPHIMYSKGNSHHSPAMTALPATPVLVISDFSPAQDHQQGGGTKVLICLANEIAEPFRQHVINVYFGDFRSRFSVKTRAEMVSPSVLRCKTPPNAQPGHCQLWIEDEQNVLRSEPADQPFEFLAPVSIGSVTASRSASKLGKRSNFRDSEMRIDATATGGSSEPLPASPHGYRLPSHFANSILRRSSPLRGDSVSNSDFDKEHKIRIVEKLGTMKYALTHEEPVFGSASFASHSHDTGFTGRLTPRAPSSHGFGDGSEHAAPHDGVKWLDDQELSEMSTEDLEVLMDRYIMVVVKQLVQLAVMDDDLKAEIDSLDSSGFSLLHYCCLYNLNSLIPVLLARGADVNRRNSTGSTALHLAAASGHFAVVQVLVESGAVVDSYDANNVLPSDAAYEAGYMDIFNLLLTLENREMDTSTTAPSAAEVTVEMHDANAQMLYGSSPVSSHNIAFLPTAPLPGPLGPLTFSPVATAKSRTEVPILKFDSPPPAFPGTEIFDPASVSLDGSNALSNKLLQEAFASLSLTDKCALSLSMGQLNPDGSKKTPASNSGIPSATSTPRTLSKASVGSPLDAPVISTSAMTAAASLSDEMSEIQSVLSETDQESLQKAMSMMRHSELEQVEAEVRTIQNNVRGWILRKNYTNLREAARVLQVAWREKKRNALSHSDMLSTPSSRGTDSPSLSIGVTASACSSAKLSTHSDSPSHAAQSSLANTSGSFVVDPNRAQLQAAATLQAATRGMLARRSFSSVRKQTMASLVIQKSLVKWWEHNKVGSLASPAKPTPN